MPLDCSSPAATSEAADRADVFEVAETVVDSDKVEDPAERADRDADAVGTAEAAELAAPFEVRLDFEEDARRAELLHPLLDCREPLAQVAEDRLVAGAPGVGWDEVLEPLFIDVAGPAQARINGVVLDVQPAEGR